MTAALDPALIDAALAQYESGEYTLREVADSHSLNYWTMRRAFQRRGIATNTDVAVERSAKKRTGARFTHCGRCGTADNVRGQWCPACGASRRRWQHIEKTYGMSSDDYRAMLGAQGGACALCRKTPDYSLRVDHDHADGHVRGLLCINCNRALGAVGDDEAGIMRALEYVRR